jgi:membrane associated rhomboid family serine protease
VATYDSAVIVAVAPSRQEAELRSLVLSASGVPHQLLVAEGSWSVAVEPEDATRAQGALEAYERENEPSPHVQIAPPLEYGATHGGLALAAALIACHATFPASWQDAGSADATRILRGELWRAVTALTLHADAAHAAANAAGFAVFGAMLFRALGPGLGGALLLGAGIAANLADAVLQEPGHVVVGASGAVFAAIGALAGLQLARRWRLRRTAWLPVGAALGLLAMLGTSGERTDVLAHFLGLAVGLLLGALAGIALARPPRLPVQLALVAAALGIVVQCWRMALGSLL